MSAGGIEIDLIDQNVGASRARDPPDLLERGAVHCHSSGILRAGEHHEPRACGDDVPYAVGIDGVSVSERSIEPDCACSEELGRAEKCIVAGPFDEHLVTWLEECGADQEVRTRRALCRRDAGLRSAVPGADRRNQRPVAVAVVARELDCLPRALEIVDGAAGDGASGKIESRRRPGSSPIGRKARRIGRSQANPLLVAHSRSGRACISTICRGCSRIQALRPPGATFPDEQESIVEPIGAALPELHAVRDQRKPPQKGGRVTGTAVEPALGLFVALVESIARREHLALVRCPGANLAASRPAREVLRRTPGRRHVRPCLRS